MIERNNGDFDTVFEIKPLERGFGHTMGFAFRRTLLGHLSSFAICGIKVSEVEHEFQTIAGLIEDGVEFILNLKRIKFAFAGKPSQEQRETIYSFYLKVDPSAKVIKAGDFEYNNGFKPIDPDFILANIGDDIKDRKSPLEIEIFVRFDKGYTDFKTNKRYYDMQIFRATSRIQSGRFIAVDSDFSPVESANFKVSELNSASNDIEERLTLEIKTDGRISAVSALTSAAEILAGSFAFAEDLNLLKERLFTEERIRSEKSESFNDPISKIGLSKRAENALRGENINTVQALIEYGNLEMIENIGKKTSQEIKNKLQEYIERHNRRENDVIEGVNNVSEIFRGEANDEGIDAEDLKDEDDDFNVYLPGEEDDHDEEQGEGEVD